MDGWISRGLGDGDRDLISHQRRQHVGCCLFDGGRSQSLGHLAILGHGVLATKLCQGRGELKRREIFKDKREFTQGAEGGIAGAIAVSSSAVPQLGDR